MMFADCVVVCEKSREETEASLKQWRAALVRRGIKISRAKASNAVTLTGRLEVELKVVELRILIFGFGGLQCGIRLGMSA